MVKGTQLQEYNESLFAKRHFFRITKHQAEIS